MRTVTALAVVLIGLMAVDAPAQDIKPLKPVEAIKKVNEEVTVQMLVKAAKNRLEKRGEVYLDSEESFRDEKNLGIVITKTGAAKYMEAGVNDPAVHFQDKIIRVKGTVIIKEARPRIEVDDPKDIQIVNQESTKTFTYTKTKQADLEIVVHYPPGWKETDKRPGIVFFFGGGWENGTIKAFEPQAKYFASRGMVTARADYRVKSRHSVTPKECVDDARSAIRWFRQNAAKLGLDPDKIVASGGSAGGHIAACTTLMLGLEAGDPKLSSKANALILFNPVLRFGPQLLKKIDNDEAVGKAISPILHLAKDSPPTLLYFGTDDWLYKQGQEFIQRSKELGHRAEMFTAEKQPHGFFNKSPWREKTLLRTDEFLVSLGYLQGKPTIKVPDAKENHPKGEVKAISEEAFVYGFPMVMNYGVIYEAFIDKASSQYKCSFNQLYNTARVFTPKDTAVVTPNSDTPYSFFCADLRAVPVVFTIPEIEKGRYYSVQLVDFYTSNYGYVGSRTTGNKAGRYMIAGPSWKGERPEGINKVFRCETEFTFAIIRTQLFNPADIDNVKKVQAGYKLQTLSALLKTPAPPAAAEIKWPKIDKKLAESDPFAYLNFLLQFCPAAGAAEVEKPLRAKFSKIGIESGKPFSLDRLTDDGKAELVMGVKSGLEKIKMQAKTLGKDENGWRVGSAFGDRDFYKGDWTLRAAAAMAGIYGNDSVEALYPMLSTDSEGKKPDCSKNRYTLTFPKGQLPPVNAFWSVTMYDAKTQLLVENPINRYLINSPMLPDLKKNEDGSLTIYIQKDSPGKEKESNWLPAPDGPIYVVMRLYWPKEEALNGKWQPPAVTPAK